MPTVNILNRVTSGLLDAGHIANARVIDQVINLGTDVVMGTATDDIAIATLPEGAVVLAVTVQQLVVGTGTGTLQARVGTTAVAGTLASTAAVGTLATTTPANIPLVVAAGGAELNLLGATAVRSDGVIRVVAVIVEGDRLPRRAIVASRDAI